MGFSQKTIVKKPLGINKLRKRLKGVSRVKVGLPKGSLPYPDGTSVIDVGLWNEFGTINIPERSFLRTGIQSNRKKYAKINRKNLKAVLQGKLTTQKSLERLGAVAAGDVKENITNIRKPANAKSTIRKKKSANPLIDTGHLRTQITYEVDDD